MRVQTWVSEERAIAYRAFAAPKRAIRHVGLFGQKRHIRAATRLFTSSPSGVSFPSLASGDAEPVALNVRDEGKMLVSTEGRLELLRADRSRPVVSAYGVFHVNQVERPQRVDIAFFEPIHLSK